MGKGNELEIVKMYKPSQSGRQIDRQSGRQTDRQADRQTGTQTDTQVDRQTGRQTQVDRQQKDRFID